MYGWIMKNEMNKASTGTKKPRKASHWHLPVTSFHGKLQKVRGDVNRLIGYEGITIS